MDTKKNTGLVVTAILTTTLFILSSLFGVWAFIGMQESKSDVDAKIEEASAVAVEAAETAKEQEFAEREKNPYKKYTGPSTYGSLTFSIPKNWSVYSEENTNSVLLDVYAHPNVIPGIDKENNYALHVEIRDARYEDELKKLDNAVSSGKLKITAFRPKEVKDALGIVARGEIAPDTQGTMVVLPQRDKTFVITTETSEYEKDFDAIIASLKFVP